MPKCDFNRVAVHVKINTNFLGEQHAATFDGLNFKRYPGSYCGIFLK